MENRGIRGVVGEEKLEAVTFEEGNEVLVDGIFVAIRNGF